jgi:hypothetical protein
MDIFFQDPTEIPLPPSEVRIRELRAEPKPDGQRVSIYIEVDPFQKRPCLDLRITSATGEELASASIIESMSRKMDMTLHLRGDNLHGSLTLSAILYFTSAWEANSPAPPEQLVVHRADQVFENIPAVDETRN